jgi:hypothetical protein
MRVFPVSRFLNRFCSGQDGSATIEFVLLFPMFMFLFLTGFESGYYMVRNAMVERAVDISVREIRLGGGAVPDLKTLKRNICDQALILPDCINSLQIEMVPVAVAPGALASKAGPVRCVDKESKIDPATATTYEIGGENEMMLVRVCALSQPLFPTTRLGLGMQADAQGNYAIVALAAFVNEPGQRTQTATGGTGGGMTK